MTQPHRPSPPALLDELIGEILLRLPPDEPESLFRASLVCKPWRRLITDRAFLRLYRKLHRAPPVLGFLPNVFDTYVARFVLTTAFRSPDLRDCYALDCRHGRALLYDRCSWDDFLVWNPITGENHHVREPDIPRCYHNAAVLCAAAGCDHLDCHGGPFIVAFVGAHDHDEGVHACFYSSETGAWSAPSYLPLEQTVATLPSALVGDSLYFICESGMLILRYDLCDDRDLSAIDLPDIYKEGIALMPSEDGGLGLAGINGFTLYLWSLNTGPDGVAGWEKRRVIKLEMLPVNDPGSSVCNLVGFAKGRTSDIISVNVDAGVFTIELKTERATKVCEKECHAIYPYTSFCTPGRASGLPSPVTTQCSATAPLNDST